jgi:hypothetical protein
VGRVTNLNTSVTWRIRQVTDVRQSRISTLL